MESIIIHPESKEQLNAIKVVLKAMKINFEKNKSPYNPEFVTKIKASREQVKKGQTRTIDIDDL